MEEERMSQFLKALTLVLGVGAAVNLAAYAQETKAVSDSEFLIKAVSCGAAEVKFSELASKNANDAKVKEFATKMAKEHGDANKKLLERARDLKIGIVAGLEKDKRATYTNLSRLSGAEFDREYMKLMVEDHEKAISLFDTYSKTGTNADMKTFARETLPHLKSHLKEARTIYARVKR